MDRRRTLDKLASKKRTGRIYKTTLEYTNIVRYLERGLSGGYPRFVVLGISGMTVFEEITRS